MVTCSTTTRSVLIASFLNHVGHNSHVAGGHQFRLAGLNGDIVQGLSHRTDENRSGGQSWQRLRYATSNVEHLRLLRQACCLTKNVVEFMQRGFCSNLREFPHVPGSSFVTAGYVGGPAGQLTGF